MKCIKVSSLFLVLILTHYNNAQCGIVGWFKYLASIVQSYVHQVDTAKNAIESKDHLVQEMDSLKGAALKHNEMVKQRRLRAVLQRAQRLIQNDKRILSYVDVQNRKTVHQQIIENNCKNATQELFEVEGDSEATIALLSGGNNRRDNAINWVDLYSSTVSNSAVDDSLQQANGGYKNHVYFCKDQLSKIGLGLTNSDHTQHISSSIFRLCFAIDSFSRQRLDLNTQARVNVHAEVAEAAYACVNQIFDEKTKSEIAYDLKKFGIDEPILEKAGFLVPCERAQLQGRSCAIV